MDKAKDQLDRVRAAIHMYPPRNVFNMGEYALFHNAIPRGSSCKGATPSLKQSMPRVTMACCTNADGSEKLHLLFLGTAAKPRWYSRNPEPMQYVGTPNG
ncbi:hypothetical protein PF005_g21627 [Phytophthora fragariae]|uniref:DDE-1 domain-containing protein n=1 Tax=Phytophthora fragariae TaxID=53985 RepID=A0A6A3QUC6_9STRA|nr:hypothetical protein PF003_g27810 [Phytophthora fragariae]KAE8937936.1 hypothetical protein PF009_g12176 [Phytophthora fragariae]KAE8994144.1 hypothetical protein PF011_g16843 [Phytophthora fragariae]KAE9081909.1 hypothetical protein PF007_g22483 [Phytophthora fragariae]KAE9084856.1 hypothetical protein PF010_g20673 [Phytophthora fragariae]